MNRVSYSVNGIVNSSIKTQIKNELKSLDGIRQVDVDPATGQVSVEYNPPVTEDEIRNSIEHVGCRVKG
jgi:copper chaperone CopZ